MAAQEITYNEMRALFRKPLRRDAHKGDFGRVLIIAGSVGMAGAAILCARAALRCGSGLVTISADEALFPILQSAVPEATCVPRSLTGALSREALSRYDAVCLGPGIGTDEGARALTAHVLEACGAPLVLDADGLNCLALLAGKGEDKGDKGDGSGCPADRTAGTGDQKDNEDSSGCLAEDKRDGPVCPADGTADTGDQVRLASFAGMVLTPHAGEAARLLAAPPFSATSMASDAISAADVQADHKTSALLSDSVSAADVQADRVAAALALARKYPGAVIVLKGARTLVVSKGAEQSEGAFHSSIPSSIPDGPQNQSRCHDDVAQWSFPGFPEPMRVNTTGNPGMATGGSGDVLAGVIASLLGQDFPPLTAAAAGVYLHGLAGDLMAAETGERGLTAGDLPHGVALALKRLSE